VGNDLVGDESSRHRIVRAIDGGYLLWGSDESWNSDAFPIAQPDTRLQPTSITTVPHGAAVGTFGTDEFAGDITLSLHLKHKPLRPDAIESMREKFAVVRLFDLDARAPVRVLSLDGTEQHQVTPVGGLVLSCGLFMRVEEYPYTEGPRREHHVLFMAPAEPTWDNYGWWQR
jgi:hypothetical protein